MSAAALWNEYLMARVAYIEAPTDTAELRMIETFSAFVTEYCDPVAAHEEIERLRHNLIMARVAA